MLKELTKVAARPNMKGHYAKTVQPDVGLRRSDTFPLEDRAAWEAHYAEQGYVIVSGVLSDAVVAEAKRGCAALVEALAQRLLAKGAVADACEGSPFETRLAAAPPRPPAGGGGPLATVAALAARLRGEPEDDRVVVAAPDRVVLAGAVLERLDLNGEWTPRTARVLAHATSDGADVGPALQLFDARDETLRVATLFLDGCEIIMAGDADAADDEGLAVFKVAHPSGDVELAAGSVARRLALVRAMRRLVADHHFESAALSESAAHEGLADARGRALEGARATRAGPEVSEISEPRSWFFDIVARLKGDDADAGAGDDDDDEGSVLFTEPDDDGRYRRDAFEATLPTVPEDEDEAPAPAIAAQPFPGVTVTTREGRLHVKLKRRFRKWKERHFRLSTRTMDNGRDAGPCLSMFVKSKNTFKLIPLAGTTAAASDEKPAKKRFGFVVAAPGDGAFRYEFYAATAADRDGWVADANAAAAAKKPLTRREASSRLGAKVYGSLEALFSSHGGRVDKIVLRRSAALGQCIKFHTDVDHKTFQLCLNDDFDGGDLVFAADDKLVKPRRPAGSYTVHNDRVAHGVSTLERGARYALFFLMREP